MVERRRKPLVLSSTKALINSVLNSPSKTEEFDQIEPLPFVHSSTPTLQLTAGILGLSEGSDVILTSLDDSALVGLSTSVLKRLSITSGSLILIKNGDTYISRIGQAVALDPPNADENSTDNTSLSSHSPRMNTALTLPKYASHLRVSFVKIPQYGTLETLKSSSSIESKDRQDLIDLALKNYFAIDRYLARGDLFNICIKWNCNSELCNPCTQNMQNGGDDIIYFKVASIEPSEEPVLRVNRSKTALVLGGSFPSAVPPDLLIPGPKLLAPLHGDTVQTLASILTPTLCPSALSSKFRSCHPVIWSSWLWEEDCDKTRCSKVGLAYAEAFNTARRYAPTVLLLRHFDVFRNLASHEGSPQGASWC
ncbi:Peroxisome biogenesis protein 6 [Abeliophyllum distichum]|uniref:Peroxisome biogenesis protein 6 n=1 Tax=Abeliophyllum distichum TaxID=126358 RepID=A0ABD1VT07_9LAMI